MSEFVFKTPVVFIVFNRPDTTARVFGEIAKARPPRLLLIGDGPRAGRAGEADKVAAVRALVQKVDWPCELSTNFSDVNLGCKRRVSSGIDWAFSLVEEAIILEDDCLPDPSFFRFCQEMLERYRHDDRVGMVSGDNFQFGRSIGADDYYFSKYVHIWGWATWRSRWVGSYDVDLKRWPRVLDEDRIADLLGSGSGARFWTDAFQRTYAGMIDTWDYQWVFANWVEGRLSVMPAVNLISNLGFGVNATHTTNSSPLADLPTQTLSFPLKDPVGLMRNQVADQINHQNCFHVPWQLDLSDRIRRNQTLRMIFGKPPLSHG